MWECIKCGCKAIAADLGFCPGCFKPKEDDMPKATTGGASNANAEPGEPGYIDPEAVKAEAAKVLTDAGADPGDVAKVTAPDKADPEKPAAPAAAAKAAEPPPAPAAKAAAVPANPVTAPPVAAPASPAKPATDTPKAAA
jgi:hypothetical protein